MREQALLNLVSQHQAYLAPLGFELASPTDPARRGSHLSLRHPHAWPIDLALIDRAKVIPDFRAPDIIRFIMLIAFGREILARRVMPGLSLGILLGALVIVVSWLLTWVYVRWANRHYDPALRTLMAERAKNAEAAP